MADIGKSLKTAWMKSMEAIGNTASSIASNTKYKVNEMNLINRRREILSEFGATAYELWQKGVSFPEELEKQLKELGELDEQLNAIRTERLAGVKTEADAPQAPQDASSSEETSPVEDAPADEDAPQDTDVPTIDVPAEEDTSAPVEKPAFPNDPIEDLMAQQAAAQKTADKVDAALDTLGSTMNQMGSAIDEAIDGMSEKLNK